MAATRAPTVLTIIDGFGYNPNKEGNAIASAATPTMDALWSYYPHTLLKAAAEEVGLTFGQIGNSEVGHTAIGAGRIVPSPYQRIQNSLDKGTFYQNEAFIKAVQVAQSRQASIHIIGMISQAGVHADLQHLVGILKIVREHLYKRVYIHAILDGRDTGPREAIIHFGVVDKAMKDLDVGTVATISGRAYAMDRNKNWDRTKAYYEALVGDPACTLTHPDYHKAIVHYYEQQLDDEVIPPTIIDPAGKIKDNDVVITLNFREDRIRQIVHVISDPQFNAFATPTRPKNLYVVTMTMYERGLAVNGIAYGPVQITSTLSDVIEANKLTQLHIAETEKYAHVTYFLNGGRESKLAHEDFIHIPSDSPDKFLTNHHMQAGRITEEVVKSLKNASYDVIVINYANCDMIGHTGDFPKTVDTISYLDSCIKAISDEVLAQKGIFFLTSDHGNSELKVDFNTGRSSKDHTINPVPFFMVKEDFKRPTDQLFKVTFGARVSGILQDVAPTILSHMDLPIPEEMTGVRVF